MAVKRHKRRSKKGQSDFWWYVAIAFSVIIVGAAIWFITGLTKANRFDEATLCHDGGPKNAYLVLLDLTDPLSATQSARLHAVIDKTVASLSVDTMIAFGVVSEDPTKWGVQFAKCKPETGAQASALYENPRQIAARYASEFTAPMKATLAGMMNGVVENQSPIMEALQALIAGTPDFIKVNGRKDILIVSDMLQHSDTVSFYRGQYWDYFTQSNGADRLARNLNGVNISVLWISRAGASVPDRADVENFWGQYFDRQGSNPGIDEDYLGDL